jgi:hypothetical protein
MIPLQSHNTRPWPARTELSRRRADCEGRCDCAQVAHRFDALLVSICGDVERLACLALPELHSLMDAELVADFHCREGWSRLGERWRGVRLRTRLRSLPVRTIRERSGRRTLPDAAAFWILAVLFLMLFYASAAASPLYRVYQVQFRFSSAMLTAVFAVYVLVLLVTLLFFGSLSDYLGRLPVIITALVLSVAGCAVFLAAHNVGALYVARSLQGIATGAIGAALIGLQPAGSQRAPLVTSGFSTLGLALASLRPRIAVPPQARGTFAGAVPCFVATWALGGLYLSLGPSLAAAATGSPNLLWGGLVIFLVCGTGAVAAFALRGVGSRTAMLAGCLLLLAGVAVTFGAIAATTSVAFLAGTAVAGAGFGLGFSGAFRMTIALAAPAQSAGLVTAIFTVGYVAFCVPALIAGVAATKFGLHSTALVYSASLAALVALTTGILLFGRRQARPDSPGLASGHAAGAVHWSAVPAAYGIRRTVILVSREAANPIRDRRPGVPGR